MASQFQKAIVVGASSGIGAELAKQLAESGCQVIAIARRAEALEQLASRFPDRIYPLVHDVTHFDDAERAFEEAVRKLQGLDVIFYSSGVMPKVGPSEFNFEKDKAMIDVNVLGAIAWLNLAAERFKVAQRGTIVAIGSVAGDRGRKGQPVYNASKACVAAYVEALRNRLWRDGVTVVTIKPGPVETPMTAGLGFKGAMPVSVAADKILRLSRKSGEHYLKITHRVIFAIIRLLPGFLMRRAPL